ncbi:hypothetical protein FGG78_32560 [Thioclava sp. BHET1]|nr:hypothetical protein FGG78_32560 [Thioclava sp. BHET1]
MHLTLQRLDLLVQSIEGISIFVGHLAAEIDAGRRIDPRQAAKRVTLRELSRSLGEGGEVSVAQEEEGQVQFF